MQKKCLLLRVIHFISEIELDRLLKLSSSVFAFREAVVYLVNNNKISKIFKGHSRLAVSYEWSTARHAIHLQIDISANTFEIRAIQSVQSDVLLTVPMSYIVLLREFKYGV
jgi:hypothetical protein